MIPEKAKRPSGLGGIWIPHTTWDSVEGCSYLFAGQRRDDVTMVEKCLSTSQKGPRDAYKSHHNNIRTKPWN